MKTLKEQQLKTRIKRWIILFIVFLILSGITAFPIEEELSICMNHCSVFPPFIQLWLSTIYNAVKTTNSAFPYLSYGTDWLAFAHIVIAVAFIGPLNEPLRNIWVIQFGMIACIMIFPLALIAGPIRHIPLYWQLIDCSFGVFGMIPLYITYKLIKQLEIIQTSKKQTT